MNNEPIDFVITWVDGSDPAWRRKRDEYVSPDFLARRDIAGNHRYADNGLLRFWFRGVERFAPWVNRIFFVSDHQIPSWLDVSHPKLRIVSHEDFIPYQYLPTFNSNVILLHLPLIKDLSERFVIFNDDMFFTASCEPSVFFRSGFPCDKGVLEFLSSQVMEIFFHELFNNMCVINRNYPKRGLKASKFFNPRIGLSGLAKNFLLWRYHTIPGFYDPHLPNAYLKTVCLNIMATAKEEIARTGNHRFRSSEDITEWLYRYGQLALGLFAPRNRDKDGLFCTMASQLLPQTIMKQKYRFLCINDDIHDSFQSVFRAFSILFPRASSFEAGEGIKE